MIDLLWTLPRKQLYLGWNYRRPCLRSFQLGLNWSIDSTFRSGQVNMRTIQHSSVVIRQGLVWDPCARIQFRQLHFGVFSTPRFAPPPLSSDWIFLMKCVYSLGWDLGALLCFGMYMFWYNIYFWKLYWSGWMNEIVYMSGLASSFQLISNA